MTARPARATCAERDPHGRRICRKPAWGESRYCIEHDTAATASSLANQLEKAQTVIADLEAKNRALEAETAALRQLTPGQPDLSDREWDLLTRIAHNLLTRRIAENALQAARHDPDTRPGPRKNNEQATPGAATAAARRHGNRLITSLARACATYETARAHMWHPPRADDDRKRCGYRDCDWYGLRRNPPAAKVCGWCGRPFPGDTKGDS